MSNFHRDKAQFHLDMAELEEKAEEMINDRLQELDHDATVEETDKIQQEVWDSLVDKTME